MASVGDFFTLLGGITVFTFVVVLVMLFVYEYDIRRREKS